MPPHKYEYLDPQTNTWKPSFSIADDKEMKRMNVIIGRQFYRKVEG